jgi:hypothetical protein
MLDAALEPRRLALVVGTDQYDHPAFPPLKHALADASSMAEVFESPQGGGFDEVQRLENPTRVELFRELKRLEESVRPEDEVVIYVSGHGTRVPDGADFRRFLVNRDAAPSDLEGTAVDLDALTQWFGRLRPSRKALIVDACFNGDGKSAVRPEHRGETPNNASMVSTTSLTSGEALLFATMPGRPSLEDDKLGHGVYTYYLLEAMGWGFAEADRDNDGVMTAWEAHDHARSRTLKHTNDLQVPEAAFRVVGMADVVLAGRPTPRKERERALVYLYPSREDPLAGAELMVDGRMRGSLPGTVPLEPGRHHLALTGPGGVVLAEGYTTLSDGHAYRADALARLVDGPRIGVSVRAVQVLAPALKTLLGPGATGLEVGLWHRDDDAPGRGQVVGITGGVATSPKRPTQLRARGLGWAGVEVGWQNDWRRVRARLTWTAQGVLIPPNYAEGRDPLLPAVDIPDQAGWIFGTTGPALQAGWVFSEVWSVHGRVQPMVTALAVDSDRVRAIPILSSGLGIDAVF